MGSTSESCHSWRTPRHQLAPSEVFHSVGVDSQRVSLPFPRLEPLPLHMGRRGGPGTPFSDDDVSGGEFEAQPLGQGMPY